MKNESFQKVVAVVPMDKLVLTLTYFPFILPRLGDSETFRYIWKHFGILEDGKYRHHTAIFALLNPEVRGLKSAIMHWLDVRRTLGVAFESSSGGRPYDVLWFFAESGEFSRG